jgi:transcriptional regulator with XRE-family HTH domain
MNFHKRLRRLRAELGLSYQTIGDACDVKWQTVQQWCKDDGTYPRIENLEPLARLLKTTPWYLLWGVEAVGNPPNNEGIPPLTDEAESLIQEVLRLDGQSGLARKMFPIVRTMLALAGESSEDKNHATGKHEITMQQVREAEKALSMSFEGRHESEHGRRAKGR